MRELIKNGAYSFTNNTRKIAVVDGRSFTAEDIRLIINETKKIVIASSMQKDNLISVIDGVITYSDTIATLATGDKLTIEIDFGLPESLSLQSEIKFGKERWSTALNKKGVPASTTDSYVSLYQKTMAIVGDVYVLPSKLEKKWHDIAQVMAQNSDPDYGGMIALLYPIGITTIELALFPKVVFSDGQIRSGISSYTYDLSKDSEGIDTKSYFSGQKPGMTTPVTIESNVPGPIGNVTLEFDGDKSIFERISEFNYSSETVQLKITAGDGTQIPINEETIQITGGYIGNYGKETRWAICYIPNPQDTPAWIMTTNLLAVLFHRVNPTQVICNTKKLVEVLYSDCNYSAITSSNMMSGNSFTHYLLSTNSDSINITGSATFQNCQGLSVFRFSENLKNISITGISTFKSLTSLQTMSFPDGLENLTLSGSSTFESCTGLSSVIFPDNLKSFALGNSLFYACGNLSNFVLGKTQNKWKFSFNPLLGTSLPAGTLSPACLLDIRNKIIDLRSSELEDVYVTITSGDMFTWRAKNSAGTNLIGHAKFTSIFSPGETVIVNISGTSRSYVINQVINDNTFTVTSNTNMVAGNYLLNHNKIINVGSANISKLNSEQISVFTTKKWQLT